MDLNEAAFTNRVSLRRFFVLARGLPAESAFQRFLSDRKNRDLVEINDMVGNLIKTGAGK